MSSSGHPTQVVDVTYDDPRTGQRVWERKVQEVPYDEIEQIRGQELALFRPADARARADRRDERDDYRDRAYDGRYVSRPRPRERLAPPAEDRYGDRYDDRYVLQRRERERHHDRRGDRDRRNRDDTSESDSESSRERHRRHRHRRAKSEQASKRGQDNSNEDDEGTLWWSGKPRKDANLLERNFDSHYDGIIAAAAGAAIGAITARNFAGEENRRWKVASGALAGAAAFNVAENKYRLYTEDKEEQREKQGKRKKADDVGLDQPLMLGGALAQGGMLPGLG